MISKDDFKQSMGRFASGVTVITMKDGDEVRGMTASAFISVSLEPPLVLESVAKKASSHAILQNSSHYGVSILSSAQADASNHFAGFGPEGYAPKFEELAGFPVLDGAIVQLKCKISAQHDAGDHSLFVAEVEACNYNDDAPLLFFRGKYGDYQRS